jgi:hypothetical protein
MDNRGASPTGCMASPRDLDGILARRRVAAQGGRPDGKRAGNGGDLCGRPFPVDLSSHATPIGESPGRAVPVRGRDLPAHVAPPLVLCHGGDARAPDPRVWTEALARVRSSSCGSPGSLWRLDHRGPGNDLPGPSGQALSLHGSRESPGPLQGGSSGAPPSFGQLSRLLGPLGPLQPGVLALLSGGSLRPSGAQQWGARPPLRPRGTSLDGAASPLLSARFGAHSELARPPDPQRPPTPSDFLP